MLEKRKRIESLNIIRCFSFLLICLHHTKLELFTSSGYYGVSVFLILSGFLMTYNHYGKEFNYSLIDSIKYAINKIKDLYPLHKICTIAMLPFLFIGDHIEPILNIVLSILTNVLLIQEWLPLNIFSINGVSWFISVLFLAYIVFPFFVRFMEKHFNNTKSIIFLIVLFLLQIVVAIIDSKATDVGINSILIKNDFSYWLVYEFAFVRLIDFLIGCCVGYCFIHKDNDNDKDYTIYEILIVLLQVVSMILSAVYNKTSWRYTVVFTLFVVLLIYVFALEKGKISKINNETVKYISRISRPGFIIHYVVFRYMSSLVTYVLGRDIEHTYGPLLKLTIGMFITIVLCEIYIRIEERFKNKLFNK